MTDRLVVQAIVYHTGGEPFRIVTGGVGPIPGATILKKRRYATEHLDRVRQLLVYEPRGHADMYGCFVTEGVSDDADLGVIFFHNEGYSIACGHGTIALVTAAIETGMVPLSRVRTGDGTVRLVLDAPSGRLETVAALDSSSRVSSVCFQNVPSYVDIDRLTVRLPDGREITTTIAFGGAFYALVDVQELGLHVEARTVTALIAYGRQIKAAVEAAYVPTDPLEPELQGIYGVMFAEILDAQTETQPRRDRNVTIFADGQVDRSPCGSGTSARLAALHASGQLLPGESLVHDSIIGSRFVGSVVEATAVADHPAVITRVEGSAWLCGYGTFVLERDDPLGTGFLLR
jgi:proline racemase